MPKLFPTVPSPDALGPGVVRYTRPASPPVLPDLNFDFTFDLKQQIGDIRTEYVASSGLKNLRIRQRAEAAIAQAVMSTLAVQRGWHSAFRRGYGIDYERAMALPSWGMMVADLENQFVAQLTRITGVAGVSGFAWRRDNERARVRMVVRLISGARFIVEAPVPV